MEEGDALKVGENDALLYCCFLLECGGFKSWEGGLDFKEVMREIMASIWVN